MMRRKLAVPKAEVKEYAEEDEDLDEAKERMQSPALKKVNEFVDNCFYALQLDPEKDEISRLRCAQLFYELMLGHKYGKDWDDKIFNTIYD